MVRTGKCPKCEKVPQTVYIEDMDIKQRFNIQGAAWKGVSYLCSHCNAILGVSIDPVALKHDYAKAVVDALKKSGI